MRLRALPSPILAAVLAGSAVIPRAALADTLVAPSDDPAWERARDLYDQGKSKYTAAEYALAIDLWTNALDHLDASFVDADTKFLVNGDLRMNIARARVQAYETDRDPSQLRKALAIYKAIVTEADAGSPHPAENVEEARREVGALRTKLDELDAKNNTTTGPTGPSDTGADKDLQDKLDRERRASRAKGLGIGLVVGGVVLTGLGVGALVWGSGFEGHAEEEVLAEAGNPPNYEFTDAELAFIEDEKQKGTAFMGGGAAIAVVGLAGVGVGAWQLAKAKKIRNGQAIVTPALGPRMVGLSVSGRF